MSLSIIAENLGKRFNRHWIFRNLNHTFESGNIYAITGPNGSGKSTLLQTLWGQLPPSEGTLRYSLNGKPIDPENFFQYIVIATPYMDLIEEFTPLEQLQFHFTLKRPADGLNLKTMLELLRLEDSKDKPIANFSSGMKQRLKLGLAFFSQADAIFLDEPGTNLDAVNFEWYKSMLQLHTAGKLVFIASNQPNEYPANVYNVSIEQLKSKRQTAL